MSPIRTLALAPTLLAAGLLGLSTLAVPVQAATLSGQVRASDGGQGIEDAIVVAYDLRLSYEYTTTNEDGGWTLADLPAGGWRLRVLPSDSDPYVSRFYPATRDFCSSELLWVDEDQGLDGLDFSLETGVSITGRLLDQDDQPVPDAVVTALGADATVTGMSRDGRTDDDGVFTLHGLDVVAGDTTAWLCDVEVEGWPQQYLGEEATYDQEDAAIFELSAGDTVDLGSFSLLDGILLGGQVRGPDGPAEGATVHAYAGSQIVSVTTDADGRYEAIGLPTGSALVWSTPDGLATTYYPDLDRPGDLVDVLEEGEVRDDLDLDAPVESTLDAVFTGAGSGVKVMLYNSTYTVGKGTSADEEGVARIDGLHAGEYTLFAWGYQEDLINRWVGQVDGEPTPFEIGDAEDLELEIALEPGARLSGQLTDDWGEPVYGGAVYLTQDGTDDTWSAVTERDGTWTLGGMAAGDWQLQVSYGPYCDSDPGYVPLVWPGSPNAADALPLSLTQGEQREGIDLELPRDDEHDGMSDRWEAEVGLDSDRDDSAEDPDGDGWTNLEEYLLGTDPFDADPQGGQGCGGCGKGQASDSGAALLLLPGVLLVGRRRRR